MRVLTQRVALAGTIRRGSGWGDGDVGGRSVVRAIAAGGLARLHRHAVTVCRQAAETEECKDAIAS
jgi:hypothetical protein